MESGPPRGLVEALGTIVSGCFVLTHNDERDKPRAILLSFVQQVGFDPPRIVLAIRKGRPIVSALEQRGDFVLNVCASDDDTLLERFASPQTYAATWFEGAEAERVVAGFVLKRAAAYLLCVVNQRVDSGDHWLYIADVLDGAKIGDRAPVVHIRKNGLSY